MMQRQGLALPLNDILARETAMTVEPAVRFRRLLAGKIA
jgi:hypothetical protein